MNASNHTDGRVALVTGASRGIGRAIARRLGREGVLVAIHYNSNSDAAAEAVEAVKEAGGDAFAVRQPLGAPGDVASLFEQLDAELTQRRGTTKLDIAVSNAAIAIAGALDGLTPEVYEEQMAINTRAPLFVAQAAARRMSAGGRIVTITSGTTLRALPDWLVYTMGKVALNSMTKIIAQDLAPAGITVNAVSPGVIDTDMNADSAKDPSYLEESAKVAALGRIGRPDDIADVVAFVVSDASRWITGHVFDASGGSFLSAGG